MGRRWGKTLMGGVYGLGSANRGAAVAWVVPTFRNAHPLWRFCDQAVGHLPGVRLNRTEHSITFPSRGWLGIFSADNDVAIRGEAFDVVVVDEAARLGPETFSDVILPTLADRDGRCLLISTPNRLNWFHTEFVRAQEEGRAWQAPTSANPIASIQRAAELARERVSERTYAQEWLAQFVGEGAVFRNVLACSTASQQYNRIDEHNYVFGVDWAKSNDYTVISVIDTNLRAQVCIERFNQIDYHVQLARLAILAQKFLPQLIVAEGNSIGAPLVEQLHRMRLPVHQWTATNASKAAAVESLGLAFEQGVLKILHEPVQTGELLAFESERLPSGMTRYAAPEGGHDDCVVALMLAWLAACSGDSRPKMREFRVDN